MIKLDRYTVVARVLPALVVLAPLTLAFMAWVPVTFDPWKWAGAGLATTVIAYFVSQLTRDAGRKLETKLWAEWGGGTPSAVFLRHDTPGAYPGDKAGLHRALTRLNPALTFPSPVEESDDPGRALAAYERAAAWLRGQTRDPKRFPLLLEENISYGFRRNLLALRPWGLLSSAICLGSAGLALWTGKDTILHLVGDAVVGGYALLSTKESLRRQSDNYTRRLFEAVDVLQGNGTKPKAAAAPAKRGGAAQGKFGTDPG